VEKIITFKIIIGKGKTSLTFRLLKEYSLEKGSCNLRSSLDPKVS